MTERTNNYSKHAESARMEFLKWDQETMISRFSLEHNESCLYITFFNKQYSIDRQTGKVTCCDDGLPASFEAVMTIYDMLCYSKSGAKLSGEWKSLVNLSPHSNFGSSDKNMFAETAERFSGKLQELCEACTELGGRPATKADAGYEFDAFPFLPVIFQYWEGDEDFKSKVSFLFDANTLDYIHFETAWYVAGYLTEMIRSVTKVQIE